MTVYEHAWNLLRDRLLDGETYSTEQVMAIMVVCLSDAIAYAELEL